MQKTEEDKAVIQKEIDNLQAIDKATDEYIKGVCQVGSMTSDACQSAHKIIENIKAQYDAEYSSYPASNPLLVRELFYNIEAAKKVDAAFTQSEAGVWMYTLENYMNTHGVSFEEAYEKHKLLIDVNVMANVASYLIMTKVAVDIGYKPVSARKGNNITGVATAEDLLAGKGTIAPQGYNVDPKKFDYFFGKVTTGNSHNVQRSAQNLKDLNTLGIKTEQQLVSVFNKAASKGTVVSQKSNNFGTTITKSVNVSDCSAPCVMKK